MRDLELELEAELESLMRVLAESDLGAEAELFAGVTSSQGQTSGVAALCNDKDLPQPEPGLSAVSAAKIQCPTRADVQRILNSAVRNAVQMLDNTIAELTNARKAACQGKPLGWPLLNDITACWLKYKLGVCIEDRASWSAGTFESGSVAEVIRRLVRPRNLLAGNEILFICETECAELEAAWTTAHRAGKCIPGTPDRIIHLCPVFWGIETSPFQAQIIIHEASHLAHCGGHRKPPFGTSIGEPYCLAEFVVATNGKPVHPRITKFCGFTPRCGTIPPDAMQRNCGEVIGSLPPDWKP